MEGSERISGRQETLPTRRRIINNTGFCSWLSGTAWVLLYSPGPHASPGYPITINLIEQHLPDSPGCDFN